MELFIRNARVSFASGLFNATAMEENQTKKFGADFLIDDKTKVFIVDKDGKHVASTMPAVMLAVAEATWPGLGKATLVDLEASKKCFRDGNKRKNKNGEVYEGYAGLTFVAAKNKTRPGLFDMDGVTPITEESGRLFSGCRVNAGISITSQTDVKRKGVHAVLRGVQFAGEDTAFSGAPPAKAGFFDPLTEGADADDLT